MKPRLPRHKVIEFTAGPHALLACGHLVAADERRPRRMGCAKCAVSAPFDVTRSDLVAWPAQAAAL